MVSRWASTVAAAASVAVCGLPVRAHAEPDDTGSAAVAAPQPEPLQAGLFRERPVDAEGASFTPGKGLTVRSADGAFALTTGLRGQFRYTLRHDGARDSTTHGMQLRRARVVFRGHAWNEHNKFKSEIALSPRDIGLLEGATLRSPVLDWTLDFTYLRDASVRVGQYKLPYSRQRVVSSGALQLVDRSIANAEFNLDRDIGFDVHSEDFLGLGHLRYSAGLYFGEGRDQATTDSFEMLYVARLEVLPWGMFEDYAEADFERSRRPRASLGFGYAYHDGAQRIRGARGDRPTDGGTSDTHNATADLMFKIAGVSLFSDVYFRDGRRNFGNALVEDAAGNQAPAEREAMRTGLGWSIQAGVLVPRTALEFAARFAQARGLGSETSLGDSDEVGGGASYYFARHPLKLQLDYFSRATETQAPRRDHEVRLQLQASF